MLMLMVMTILKLLQLEVCSQTHCTRLLCGRFVCRQIPMALRHPILPIPLKLLQVSMRSFIIHSFTKEDGIYSCRH